MKKIIITIGKNSQTIFLLIVLVIGLVILLNTIAFFYKKHKNPRFSQKEFLNNIFYEDQSQVYVLVRKRKITKYYFFLLTLKKYFIFYQNVYKLI